MKLLSTFCHKCFTMCYSIYESFKANVFPCSKFRDWMVIKFLMRRQWIGRNRESECKENEEL